MPKEYFSVSHCTNFPSLASGAKIHFIGVSGVAMGQLAVALAEAGFQVSGSDIRYYEPMGSFLRSSPVKLLEGYDAKNIPEQVDLVVIGNAIRYENAEVAAVEARQLPYTFLPKLIGEFLIADSHSIVVSGTHGKTTTTCLCAHLLRSLGQDPSYFIGGVVEDFGRSLHKGRGAYCVIEGDEYDSAFFAKLPKFHFYRPRTLIINALEYDHADIYANLEAIVAEFAKIALSVPEDGHILACIDFPELARLVRERKNEWKAKLLTFGESEAADFIIGKRKASLQGQEFLIHGTSLPLAREWKIHIPHHGVYNARNACAAALLGYVLGGRQQDIEEALTKSPRPKRRQEVLVEAAEVTLIEDFAHHPTAVQQTLETLREIYPHHKIIAAFEPRSAASRRKIFQAEYLRAFQDADIAIISDVPKMDYDAGEQLLDVQELAREISHAGTPCESIAGVDAILAKIQAEEKAPCVVIVMSNGSFDGLAGKLREAWSM